MWTPYLQFVLAALVGWVHRYQRNVIVYLQAESRILREQMGDRRLRFTDAQRCRLAVAAKKVGRAKLFGIELIVAPDTLLRWYRKLVAQKYDGSTRRGAGRPRTASEIRNLVVRMAEEDVARFIPESAARSSISGTMWVAPRSNEFLMSTASSPRRSGGARSRGTSFRDRTGARSRRPTSSPSRYSR